MNIRIAIFPVVSSFVGKNSLPDDENHEVEDPERHNETTPYGQIPQTEGDFEVSFQFESTTERTSWWDALFSTFWWLQLGQSLPAPSMHRPLSSCPHGPPLPNHSFSGHKRLIPLSNRRFAFLGPAAVGRMKKRSRMVFVFSGTTVCGWRPTTVGSRFGSAVAQCTTGLSGGMGGR